MGWLARMGEWVGSRVAVRRHSAPALTGEQSSLATFLLRLISYQAARYPVDRERLLDLLVDSPHLAAPVGVYRDQFAGVMFAVYRPRSRSSIGDALSLAYAPAGRVRCDLAQELVTAGDLIPLSPTHPLHRLLYPNVDRWTGRTWRGMAIQHHLVTGESFLALNGETPIQPPSAGLTVAPSLVTKVPDRVSPDYHVVGDGPVPAWRVFEWSDPDPREPYGRGRGYAQAMGDELDAAEGFSRWFGSFSRNDFTPPWMLIYAGVEDEEDVRRRMRRQHRGWWRAHQGHVMRAPDPDLPVREQYALEKLAQDFDPAQLVTYAEHMITRTRKYFGVPPSLLGDFEDNAGLGMSGVQLEEYVYQATRLRPRADSFVDAFQALARRFDDRLVVTYRPFLSKDRDYMLKAMEKQPWLYSHDEWRAAAGHDPLEDRVAGQAYTVPAGKVIVGDLRPGNPTLEAASGSSPGS